MYCPSYLDSHLVYSFQTGNKNYTIYQIGNRSFFLALLFLLVAF